MHRSKTPLTVDEQIPQIGTITIAVLLLCDELKVDRLPQMLALPF